MLISTPTLPSSILPHTHANGTVHFEDYVAQFAEAFGGEEGYAEPALTMENLKDPTCHMVAYKPPINPKPGDKVSLLFL